jgi:TolA-binding protein
MTFKTGTAVLWTALLLLAFGVPATAGDGDQIQVSEQDLWTAAGEAFAHEGDKTAALQQYQLFLSHYKKSDRAAKAQFMLAECYFRDGDWGQAFREYDRVRKFKGRDRYLEASVMLRMGECQYNQGRLEDALQSFTRLLEKYPETYLADEALFELGQVQAASLNWRHLDKTYTGLLAERPGYRELPRVRFALGIFAYVEERYEEAAEYFGDVPSDLGLYYLGRCLEETGQYILAIQRYRQALRMYPESPMADDVAFSIAEAFYNSGQNKVAARSYAEFLDRFPDSEFNATARYKSACVDYRMEKYDDALRKLGKLCDDLVDDPICALAHYLAGTAHMAKGERSHAVFSYTEVVKRFPDSELASAAMHKIIFAYVDEHNYPQAILMAEEFLNYFPGDLLAARVQVLKGYAHMQLEEYDVAVQEFQNVMDRHVNTDVGERALFLATSTYYELEQYDRLITNYHFIANRLLPTPSEWRARTYHHLGEAYYSEGLFREAGGMYRLVLTGYPRSDVAAASLQGLVASYSQLGEYEVALEEQEKFLFSLANDDSEEGSNSLALGSLYFNQKEYEKAMEQFMRFLQANPDSPDAAPAMMNLGDCYYRLQYYENAVETWAEMLNRFPKSAEAEEATYRLADTRFGLGDYPGAIAAYKQLEQRFPDGVYTADAAFGIANCYYNTQQDDMAIAAFQGFLENFSDDPRTEDAEMGIQSAYYRSGKDMGEYLSANQDSPLAADYYWTQGQNAFAEGNYEQAARTFEKVTMDYADSESAPAALFYLAESYYRMEQNEQALAGYRNFTLTHGDDDLVGLARFREGTVLFKEERFEEAAGVYELLTDQDPDGQYAALALYNAGLCYQEMEDWASSIGVLMRFQADYPDDERNQGIWYQIATLYQEEMGDYESAIDAYDRTLQKGEAGIEEIGYRQGECYVKLGRTADAVASYERSAGGADIAAPHRIASLAQIGSLSEESGDWSTAVSAYTRIVQANGKPEWTAMAQGRLEEIRAMNAGQ